jgi:outer membrane biosynthesis protein TonB
MKTASRTLVKSPPEVWEQLDHPGRMQGLMSALVGHATDVSVYEREEEAKLAWKAESDEARIEVELAEKGWGTNVSVSAENGHGATKLEGWLDAVLDELATPTKRPFEGMSEGTEPAPEQPEAPQPEIAVVEETPAEPEPEEPVEEEAPAAESPPPEPPAPKPKKKRRRFFGL